MAQEKSLWHAWSCFIRLIIAVVHRHPLATCTEPLKRWELVLGEEASRSIPTQLLQVLCPQHEDFSNRVLCLHSWERPMEMVAAFNVWGVSCTPMANTVIVKKHPLYWTRTFRNLKQHDALDLRTSKFSSLPGSSFIYVYVYTHE